MKDYKCYTDEWKRSNPDFIVYLPKDAIGPDSDNVHFLVILTPGRDLLGFWTQATYEVADNSCVVCSRSIDGGTTWSKPAEIDGPNEERYHTAYYAFPIVSKSGRIYCFYKKHTGVVDVCCNITSIMRCRYSDNDGHTWSKPVEITFKRRSIDNPNQNIPPNWVAWTKPIRDSRGRWLEPFTRWISHGIDAGAENQNIEMMRFDNIDESPEPEDIKITWLPEEPVKPVTGLALTGLIEPCIVLLPDGRLFMVTRTETGCIWYSVSKDDGAKWRESEPLRYQDNGERILHPDSPPPLYALQDGRFLLQYHNNDGSMSDGPIPMWTAPYKFNRRSIFFSVGEFRPQCHQPIWFSKPKRFADSDGVAAGVQYRTEMGTYSSLTEEEGRRILWYPDRKHFLLGKVVSDEWLVGLKVPTE